jgi:hypothetical protein
MIPKAKAMFKQVGMACKCSMYYKEFNESQSLRVSNFEIETNSISITISELLVYNYMTQIHSK